MGGAGGPVQEIGRTLLVVGIAVAAIGLALLLAGRLGVGRLPGDVVLRGGNWTFYFPIVTSVLLSLLLTGLLWLLGGRRR